MIDCQLSLIFALRVTGVAISARNTMGSLSNDDGDGNEERQKAIDLLRKITTLHLYNAFLYFSLPSLHDYDARIPEFTLYGGHKQATTNFFSLSKLECCSQETKPSTLGNFAYIWCFQRIGINATMFEKTRMHSFQCDVFAAVAVFDAKTPNWHTPVGTAAGTAMRTPCVGTCSPGFARITRWIEKRRTANSLCQKG